MHPLNCAVKRKGAITTAVDQVNILLAKLQSA